MRTPSPRAGLAAAAALAALTTGCTARVTATGPTSATAPAAATPTGTTAPAATAPPATSPVRSPDALPRNLTVPPAVRADLVAAWVAAQHLKAGDVAGTRPGSVYYGYVPSSRTYWAVAGFIPSAAAERESRTAPDGGPLVQFQDGPWVLTRPADGVWRVVTDTGGRVCPGAVPAPMLAAWDLPTTGC